MIQFLKDLITNDTGVSSKSFALVVATIVGGITSLAFVIMLFIDLFTNYVIGSDLYGMAAVITALGSFAAAIFWGKIKSEKTRGEYYEGD